jgi:hypothetical protein
VLLALGVWLSSSGCFDVREVPVDPIRPEAAPKVLLIDDFEDGDVRPSSSAFAAWRCTTYNPGPGFQPVQCGPAEEGFDSPHGYSLWAELHDLPNGVLEYPGASLFAPTPVETWFDASPYEMLRFSAKLTLGGALAGEDGAVSVTLSCDGESSTPISVDSLALLSAEWQRVGLRLADFAQPDWQSERVDNAICVTQISGLSFDFGGPEDGQTGTGTLLVDDVYLQ